MTLSRRVDPFVLLPHRSRSYLAIRSRILTRTDHLRFVAPADLVREEKEARRRACAINSKIENKRRETARVDYRDQRELQGERYEKSELLDTRETKNRTQETNANRRRARKRTKNATPQSSSNLSTSTVIFTPPFLSLSSSSSASVHALLFLPPTFPPGRTKGLCVKNEFLVCPTATAFADSMIMVLASLSCSEEPEAIEYTSPSKWW